MNKVRLEFDLGWFDSFDFLMVHDLGVLIELRLLGLMSLAPITVGRLLCSKGSVSCDLVVKNDFARTLPFL